MTRLGRYLKPFLFPLAVLLVLLVGQATANLALPDYLARIVDKGIVGQDTGVVYRTGLVMLMVALGGGLCMIGVGFLASRIAAGAARDLRGDVFATVEQFSLPEFNRFSTASLITRCTNDVQQIQMVLTMLLRLGLLAPYMGIGALIKAYGLAPSMSWIMAVAIGALLAVIVTVFTISIPRFQRLQRLVDALNLVTRESLTGMRVIRAFTREADEEARFDRANRQLTDANLVVNRLTAVMQPVMLLVLNLTSIAVVWVGAHKIDAGTLQIGHMLAFMQYAMQAIFSFLMISMIFIMVPRAAVSARRVVEVLETAPSIQDPALPEAAPARGGAVEFRGVTFAYPGAEEPVLRDVTFTARSGQTTAIVGPTGSGKSTLLSLILRFYDATAGQVLVDGVDVRAMRQAELRARIGYVSQRAVLFSGTVAESIAYGAPGADEGRIARAAATAQAAEFIEAAGEGDGYRRAVAQGGANLSGGQKQRLAIARAVARDPEIFLFDDSFSALDFRTDALLRAALHAETADKTVLIVAQRISTIMHAEQILVLDAGRVVGIGRHAELLRTCTVYRELAVSQLSAAELATSGAVAGADGLIAVTEPGGTAR